MAGKLLVDTSVIIDVFTGDEVAQRLVATAEKVLVPSIALGELFYGAQRSGREAEFKRVNAFAASSSVLSCDLETARRYGVLRNALRAKGRPIPDNDIWIAALGVQHGLTIATRDSHFRELDGVALVIW
jgi:tRNA(fMet)-specific endonuclease VapC